MADADLFLQQLLETFRVEAQDHLGALTTLLVALENERLPEERKRLLESTFRRMHTLKGAAHAVNLTGAAAVCQDLEELLSTLKRDEAPLQQAVFDRLHGGVELISELILHRRPASEPPAERLNPAAAAKAAPGGEPPLAPLPGDAKRPGPAAGEAPQPAEPAPTGREPAGHADETVRVSTRLLGALLLQAEELISTKLAASALVEQVGAAVAELAARESQRVRAQEFAREALRAGSGERLPRLASLLEESLKGELLAQSRLKELKRGTERHLWGLRCLTDPLLEDVKKLHLLPFSTLAPPFVKLVRDLARELDKEAELTLEGGEIELDRRILAELKEPLLHMLRNVMDHGVEKPAQRSAAGKGPRGEIRIAVRLLDANLAEVTVSDDGRGIDLEQVRQAALKLEVASAEALKELSEQELLQLVFESGLSTSQVITSLSGRGVGLPIVRETLERLGGHVTLHSVRGEGTWFRLYLPLSFSMMSGLLVEAGGRPCMLPAAHVEQTARVPLAEIGSVENRETVLLDGELFSLARLSRLLELSQREEEGDGFQPVVLLAAAERRLAFAVDRVLGVQEILVKPLGPQLSRVKNVAGATVLGDGRVVPILNVSDLFRSAVQGAAAGVGGAAAARSRSRRVSVLVAEDSITSRTLLKNILESSGFQVRTAVDGVDAFSRLKSEGCDVVVSDVEMPRMDGFELTAAIRADGRFGELPVVLVTGLESRADRERGIEVGANAYLVKSSFDQSGLIEIIKKLT